MYFFYEIALSVYVLAYLPYLLLTRRWYPGFGMRFGFFSGQLKKHVTSPAIWIHAVSVGEVMAIDGFIDQLRKDYPHYQVVVTITTKTGLGLGQERLKSKALVIPSPIDFSWVVQRFISLIDPKLYVSVETEIWPNLYRRLHDKKIPLIVVNGRISDSSWERYKVVSNFLKPVLNQVSAWCMQGQIHAQRIMALGAEPLRVEVTGNIKFDNHLPKAGSFKGLAPHEGPWWVAGSTHPGEEEIVLDVYKKVIAIDPRWKLIIAPRHIERVPQILELITQSGFKAVKFSDISASVVNGAVVVLDTVGDLQYLYALASLVFVGKSLTIGGGHNIIEPAVYAKAIVIGPKVENFRDIVACFNEKCAIVQVQDKFSFAAAVLELCKDPNKREALGKAAQKVIDANQGATQRSLKRVAVFLK